MIMNTFCCVPLCKVPTNIVISAGMSSGYRGAAIAIQPPTTHLLHPQMGRHTYVKKEAGRGANERHKIIFSGIGKLRRGGS